jgi:hypothetical protein
MNLLEEVKYGPGAGTQRSEPNPSMIVIVRRDITRSHPV